MKPIKFLNVALISALLLGFSSCDKEDEPGVENPNNGYNNNITPDSIIHLNHPSTTTLLEKSKQKELPDDGKLFLLDSKWLCKKGIINDKSIISLRIQIIQ